MAYAPSGHRKLGPLFIGGAHPDCDQLMHISIMSKTKLEGHSPDSIERVLVAWTFSALVIFLSKIGI